MLEAGETAAALAELSALRERTPDDPALDRSRLEERARALTERGKPDAAVALLRFAIDLYPHFAGTWDALAEAQLARNDEDGEAAAREASREVLRLLETDFTPTASWRVVYRRNAERRLTAPPPGNGNIP
jgi:predicted Zn-dependent protease